MSAYSSEWYTPVEWIAWIHQTFPMGFADPYSCFSAQSMIQATVFGTKVMPLEWTMIKSMPAYCNPPGRSLEYWSKWIRSEHNAPIIWAMFNPEGYRKPLTMFDLPGTLVIPTLRVKWIEVVSGKRRNSPRHWTWFWVSGDTRIATLPEDCRTVKTPFGGTQFHQWYYGKQSAAFPLDVAIKRLGVASEEKARELIDRKIAGLTHNVTIGA